LRELLVVRHQAKSASLFEEEAAAALALRRTSPIERLDIDSTLTSIIVSMTEIACTLSSHDLAAQARRWQALPRLQREETEDGLRVTFAREAGVEDELRALVAVENDCCRWAQWNVEDGVVLVATASGDGVAVLHGMLR